MFKHSERANGNRAAVILVLLLTIITFSRFTVEAQNTTVTGVVKNASGEPLAGVLVKVRSADLGLGFMVVSQAEGRYSTPNLLPGKYTVQGFGGGYQSNTAGPVEVTSGHQEEMDIVLSTLQKTTPPPEHLNFRKTITNADYANVMPEGAGKRLLTSRCVLCHSLDRIFRVWERRATREEWEKIVDQMRDDLQDRRLPLSGPERDSIVSYVSKDFGSAIPGLHREQSSAATPDPNGNLPRTLLTGTEAKFVAMEFSLQRGIWIHHIAVDSLGIAWFSETNGGVLGRFDPTSLTYTRIVPPPGKFPERFINAVRVDPQDHVWFTDNDPNGLLLQYNPKGNEFQTYDIPFPPGLHPRINTLRFLDGNVWGTGISQSEILRLDPRTRKWTQYRIPRGSHPYGIAVGGDKMIWYVGQYDNDVVRLDFNTGNLTHYKVPTPNSALQQMQADAEGNLWVVGYESGKLVKVDYRSGKVTEYTPPTKGSGPFTIDVDTKRNLIWFGEMNAEKLGRYDPRTNSFVEFPLPSVDWDGEFSDSKVIWIEVDRSHPNRVWWGGGTNARIGYLEVIE